MKKSVVLTTTAATIGLVTVLTVSSVAPSFAKSSSHNTVTTKSAAKSSTKTASGTWSATADARKFTSVNFTITNVPSTITDAATAAKLLAVKVVPLAADATAAPATAPLPSFGNGAAGAPGKDGARGHGPKGDNDGDHGTWTPSTSATPTAAPSGAPTFGDNDGDGPAKGFGKGGRFGKGPHGMQLTNLVLANGTLTGTIQLPGDEAAGVQKFGIYLSIAADSANGITAQQATPVMVTVTTAADLTPSVTATTSAVTLAITK